MAKTELAIGAGVAAQALAAAALEMLLWLGHDDVIEEVKSIALHTVNRSIDEASNIDKDRAKDHARHALLALVETIKLKQATDKTRQDRLS
ncbi:hypothetical protein I7F13_17575 [Sinorhizobium meliloti]|uniref:hypothetical protein n=1 Tax=Rhizobium meliloti TaxID=382 RepID=UPI000FDB9E89|nr:hypothetical protein [Sinorhizobium meliloti]MDE3824012.1 hypothetical protein [Sinorhizobium meliloti]RVM38966.1 hypothetical protein CN127_33905 [Sinorhizobium meliloti]RVN63859.1 hypothetical protein CN106_22945 [Sinorhizobium meliloti]